ncbi:MAG: plasmid recombination protein [Clostridia bacterium]
MANKNGQDYAVPRVKEYNRSTVTDIEKHNERKNQNYSNEDIDINRSHLNVHFKKCDDTYLKSFDRMCEYGIISTRGLKPTATIIDEMMLDVNSSFFERKASENNCTAYDYAKEFYSKAYEFVVNEAGGEHYILSAVMHADERNSALSEELGKDVYHYHLHVTYIPVVQKEIKWSKRCKDKSLVGTVKDVINQVSHSKKWASKLIEDENGKKYLERSYSLLQDRFPEYMQNCGYTDVVRGEKGSTEKHLSSTKYKAKKENEKLEKAQKDLEQVNQKKVKLNSIEKIEVKSALLDKNKVVVLKKDFLNIKNLAKKYITSSSKEKQLNSENTKLQNENKQLKTELEKYKSIRNRLDENKKSLKLSELEKFQSAVYKFLDRLGIRKQFDMFLSMLDRNQNKLDR